MQVRARELFSVLKESVAEWQKDNAMRLAAALAYYTVFSLAPLVLAAIGVAGLVFGQEAASGKIYSELNSVTGERVAAAVQEMVKAADKPSAGYGAAILGFLMGLFGASGVFGELMGSLNQIWGVTTQTGGGVWLWIKGRFLSIGMVMGVCFLLLVSLLASTFIAVISQYGLSHLPGAAFLGQALTFVLSLGFVTILFAAMFKFLPQTHIEWRDVWPGALVTALLFSLGKLGLEQYMAHADPTSGYGAAGTLALLLVWVYYSAQIFFFGAEFTEVYARRLGSRFGQPAPSSEHAEAEKASPAEVAQAAKEGDVHEPQKIERSSTLAVVAGLAALVAVSWLDKRKQDAAKKDA